MSLPRATMLFRWAREQRPVRAQSYFHMVAQNWRPTAKRPDQPKRAPKGSLGLYWKGMPSTRERAAYQIKRT